MGHAGGGGKPPQKTAVQSVWEYLVAETSCRNGVVLYTTEEIVHLDEHATAINVVCMDGSDDELHFEEENMQEGMIIYI